MERVRAEIDQLFTDPARHGKVVLKNSFDDSKIATWTFLKGSIDR